MSLGDPPRFRFGIQAVRASSAAQWTDTARRAESSGYSTLFLADHYLGKGPAASASHVPIQDLGPIAAMATAAAVTSTLRVGCRVFCVDYHVPAALVKEALSIDLLSGGRLEFGLGAGWSTDEYGAIGLRFASGPDRLVKLREVVELFRQSCTGQQVHVDGRFVHADGYAALPSPVQQPHPPIMIGGGRPRVLAYAGREADIVSISNVPFDARNADGLTPQEEARRRRDWVAQAAAGRSTPPEIESSPFFVMVTDEPHAAAERLAGSLSVPPDDLMDHPNVLIGTIDRMVDLLQERRERYGVSYVTVQQREMDSFARVVDALNGK